jgi:lipopolysaccharide/colanic/teichoic acid biosynthesis glycosyltransferase
LDLIWNIGTAALAVVVAAFVATVPWLPKITEFLIQLAVKRLPEHQRARFAEEWRGHVDEIPGDLNKLDAAIGFLRAARRMTRIGKEVTGQDAPILSRVVEAAAFVALVLLPISPLLPAAIRLESAGPAFDYQPRIGLGRRRFMLVKFRSTRADDGISYGATPDGCPRLTRIGAIIRKLRLDELPQLINVLRGEMSLVGPCPAPPSVAAELQRAQPLFADRVLVKPGIIGWAQINRRCDCTSMNDAWLNLSYDLYYLKHRSWLLDLLILFRTPLAVIFSANA